MKLSDFAESFLRLFGGREDVYAVALPKPSDPASVYYNTIVEPVTTGVIQAHLNGTRPVAFYPLVAGKVRWMAMDVDGDGFESAFRTAKDARDQLERAGLHVYLERSRSGTGVHLWVFMNDWVAADVAQRVMQGVLDIPRSAYDKIYPVQSSVAAGTYGSHLALPFNGKAMADGNSMFVNDDGEVIPVGEFLAAANTNLPEILYKIAQRYPERRTSSMVAEGSNFAGVGRPDKLLEGALKIISPFGCRFMRYAWLNRRTLKEPLWYIAIQQSTAFRHGRDFAHLLSQDYPKYSESEVDAKFDQALRNPPMSCDTLRSKYPELACENCTCKFPYEMASKGLVELVSNAGQRMESLGSFTEDLKFIGALNSGEATSGISLGIPGSENLSLLRPNEVTIIGGLPSIGKSWLLTAGILGQARQGILPLAFSPETAEVSLRQRMLAHIAEVELMALRGERNPSLSTQEYKRLEQAAKELSELSIYVDYTTLSSEDVILQVERTLLKNRIPLDTRYAIWFDYLQFGFRKAGESDQERISRMASEFKIIAKLIEHPVIALSQLIRTSEGDDKPDMTWFAGSSSIERNMDSGIIVTGERVFGDYAPRVLTQVKQREGRANTTLNYMLQQGYGHWKPVKAAPPQDLRTLLEMDSTDAH